jgi:hypothetical protein
MAASGKVSLRTLHEWMGHEDIRTWGDCSDAAGGPVTGLPRALFALPTRHDRRAGSATAFHGGRRANAVRPSRLTQFLYAAELH